LSIVATVDLTKISLSAAVSYFIDSIADFPGEHYIDLAGKRIPTFERSSINGEVEKINRHHHSLVKR